MRQRAADDADDFVVQTDDFIAQTNDVADIGWDDESVSGTALDMGNRTDLDRPDPMERDQVTDSVADGLRRSRRQRKPPDRLDL